MSNHFTFDFISKENHKEIDEALVKVNDIFDRLAKNGTSSVTIADLKPIGKCKYASRVTL